MSDGNRLTTHTHYTQRVMIHEFAGTPEEVSLNFGLIHRLDFGA